MIVCWVKLLNCLFADDHENFKDKNHMTISQKLLLLLSGLLWQLIEVVNYENFLIKVDSCVTRELYSSVLNIVGVTLSKLPDYF